MAWNVATAFLKLSSCPREVHMVGVASSQASNLRETESGALYGGGSPKRQFFSAFDQQDELLEDHAVAVAVADIGLPHGDKKRRLNMDQVRFLEHSFDTDNKLEPERKLHIAKHLGLQPRQVAVWFQNRRARSKSKQLEREFSELKAKYDEITEENERLHAEVARLTALLQGLGDEVKSNDVEHGQASGSRVDVASLGVKIELELSTTEVTRAPDVINKHEQSIHYFDSSMSEILDSYSSPSSDVVGVGRVLPLALIGPKMMASTAVIATTVEDASHKVIDKSVNMSAMVEAPVMVIDASTNASATPESFCKNSRYVSPSDAPTLATADTNVEDFLNVVKATTGTSLSPVSACNPLLVRQLSLCKLQADGYSSEDYNFILAQWPDWSSSGAHILQTVSAAHDNLLVAQHWDDPAAVMDSWLDS